ncbi:MAG TPA: VOC family protein [Candidatus Limnocylindrales bacterium]|nr:VOC family protein [Candidatus Limnocylindrales bacterium]
MLPERPIHTTLPVADLGRARHFYEDVLGFTPVSVNPAAATYEAGSGTRFILFPSSGKASGTHTQMGFTVPDIEAEVGELKTRGVSFESYDMPGFDAVTSISTTGLLRAAWFRDPEGNLIGLVQITEDD